MWNHLLETAVEAGKVLKGSFDHGERYIDEHTASGDADAQLVIVRALHRHWPEIPIVVEEGLEAIVTEIMRECPGVKLVTVPKQGGLDTLVPETCFIVDPRDGSALATNGCPEYSVSIGYKQAGHPIGGVVYMPEFNVGAMVSPDKGLVFMGEQPRRLRRNEPRMSMIGLDDCKAVPSHFRDTVITPLRNAFRYPRNLPSVYSGWELAVGRTRAWVSDRAMIWDVAATAPMILALGGVVECLDGSKVPWDKVKMPPLLFADSPEVSAYVRRVLAG